MTGIGHWLVEAARGIDAALGPARVQRIVLPPCMENPGPDPLFSASVSAVGSAWVVDAEAFLTHLAAGRKWGATSRKVTLTPGSYPGFESLLKAAAKTGG